MLVEVLAAARRLLERKLVADDERRLRPGADDQVAELAVVTLDWTLTGPIRTAFWAHDRRAQVHRCPALDQRNATGLRAGGRARPMCRTSEQSVKYAAEATRRLRRTRRTR